jgi:Hypothetical glycosyl hydrolase 6
MRKIHLDFHTNENIKICEDWDTNRFGEALQKAHVSQIVCFAKGHHGNCYWGSNLGPKHPHMPEGLDLLQEQINACRKNDIRINAYYSCMLDQVLMQNLKIDFDKAIEADDENDDDDAPIPKAKWMQCNKAGIPSFNEMGYGSLCLNSSYIEDVVIPHTIELLEYDLDGIWYDICRQGECYCDDCKDLHKKWGLKLDNAADRIRLTSLTMNYWTSKIIKVIREKKPKIEVFFNTIDHFGATDPNDADFIVNNVQDAWEQEALPTGGWGYWYFPAIGRYFRNIPHSEHSKLSIPDDEPRLYGMTGMFRGSWGDNGSLKSSHALLTESASIISMGYSGVDIGDQLHPTGRLEPAVYETIGKAFKYVKDREPWIKQSVGVADVAVIAPTPGTHGVPDIIKGLTMMLVENHVQFDLIDQNHPIDLKYKLLVVPDYEFGKNNPNNGHSKYLPIGDKTWEFISNYVKNGGKIVLFGEGPSEKTIGNIQMPNLRWNQEFDVCYLNSTLPPKTDCFYPGHNYVLYSTFLNAPKKIIEGWESKVDLITPYFARTPNNFSSHRHWASNRLAGPYQPGAIKKEGILWILAPLCEQYWARADDNHRELLKALMVDLESNQLVNAPGYSAACEINLTHQIDQKRFMLHIINWGMKRPGALRGPPIFKSPFKLPQGEIQLKLGIDGKSIQKCQLIPDNMSVNWKSLDEKTISIDVPPTGFNSIIEITYE